VKGFRSIQEQGNVNIRKSNASTRVQAGRGFTLCIHLHVRRLYLHSVAIVLFTSQGVAHCILHAIDTNVNVSKDLYSKVRFIPPPWRHRPGLMSRVYVARRGYMTFIICATLKSYTSSLVTMSSCVCSFPLGCIRSHALHPSPPM
jgi:hypothetical protein